MSPFEHKRRSLYQTANHQSLRAFDELLVQREADLVEELAGDGNPVLIQSQIKELRILREALKQPAMRAQVARDPT